MPKPKYNKFNTGRTKNYFPLKRWRFNTDEHPVVKSKEKCASSTAKTLLSIQELQMLIGLTNTLQCNEREAVRIALYEASRSAKKAYEMAFARKHRNQQRRHIRDDPQRGNGSCQKLKRNWQIKQQKN